MEKEIVELSEKEERIKLEAQLLEQEHRPLKLILNYIRRNEYWKDKSDIRRKAVTKAIILRLLFSPTTVAIAGGGFLAYFSLLFMWNQNNLIIEQNKLFENQNVRIEQQTHLIEADRRSSQVYIMGEVLSDLNSELEKEGNNKRIISNTLTGRIISLSSAMKPYRYLKNDSLIIKPLSPERGQLLISLIESKIDSAYFSDNILNKCDFTYSDLSNSKIENITFNGTKLNFSDFNGAYLKNVDFNTVNLINCVFNNVTINKSEFYRSSLINCEISSSTFVNIDFDKASSIIGCVFNNSSIIASKLDNIVIEKSSFNSCEFSNLDFTGSVFDDVSLKKSSIRNSNISNVQLFGVNLSELIAFNNLKIHRKDWLKHINDSLKLKGANELAKTHVIVSDNLNNWIIKDKRH